MIVEERKVIESLLSTSHPAGRSKAAFFGKFGFHREAWEVLRDALLDHAQDANLVRTIETEFGTKRILEGPLRAPDGRMPRIRSVWFQAPGEPEPRLVTAHPARRSDK